MNWPIIRQSSPHRKSPFFPGPDEFDNIISPPIVNSILAACQCHQQINRKKQPIYVMEHVLCLCILIVFFLTFKRFEERERTEKNRRISRRQTRKPFACHRNQSPIEGSWKIQILLFIALAWIWNFACRTFAIFYCTHILGEPERPTCYQFSISAASNIPSTLFAFLWNIFDAFFVIHNNASSNGNILKPAKDHIQRNLLLRGTYSPAPLATVLARPAVRRPGIANQI